MPLGGNADELGFLKARVDYKDLEQGKSSGSL